MSTEVPDQLRDQLQRTLGSAYTLERELGGGGMSRVFLAHETRLGRTVVVKVLSPELAAGVSAARFEQEIKLAAGLQQANIVPLLSAGETEGLPFYTMPFVEGLSLRGRLASGNSISVTESVSVLRDVARALAYAHERGVVHRDIKPENVLRSGDAAVVTDFGIAKAISASRTREAGETMTQLGTSLGTPAYMAPEQAAGDPDTDHRADLYALGCLGYEMLTGAAPFAGRPAHQLLAAHMNEVPAPVGTLRAEAPVALTALVMRCLEKDPARRPQSAREVLEALDAVSSGTHVSGTAVPRRWWLPAAGLFVLAAALGTWFLKPDAPTAATDDEVAVRSVAVMPFVNENGDSASNYFASGMSDEVAGVLAKVPDLRVASRSSVNVVREKKLSPQEIGKALGVDLLLEGTVRRAGDQVRVTTQLTNAANGSLRWTQSYDRTTRDVFQLQDDIASAIAGELQIALGGTAMAASRAGRTTNAEANDLYFRALYAMATATEAGFRQSITYYERALDLDPKFARAHAGIGMVWLFLADVFVPAVDAYPRAVEAASRALAMDSLVADAHGVHGYATAVLTFDTTAIGSVQRGVRLDPNSPMLRTLHSWVLCWFLVNRCAEGVREAEKAVELDPFSPIALWTLAATYAFERRYDEAIAAQGRLLAANPGFVFMDDVAGVGWRGKGDFGRSVEAYERAQKYWHQPMAGLGVTYARMGRIEEAKRIADELEALRAKKEHVIPDFIAMLHASIGNTDRAFHWLEVARKEKSAWLFYLGVIPEYESIRADPRYAAFVRSLRSR